MLSKFSSNNRTASVKIKETVTVESMTMPSITTKTRNTRASSQLTIKS